MNQPSYGDGFDSWGLEIENPGNKRQDNFYQNSRHDYKSQKLESSLTLPPKSKMKRKEEKYLGYTSLDRNGKFSGFHYFYNKVFYQSNFSSFNLYLK